MAYNKGVTRGRIAALGIPTTLASELLDQIENADGSGFNQIKMTRLCNLGVEPIAAKATQTEINGGGIMNHMAFMKGNFMNGEQARMFAAMLNAAPVEISPPVLTGTAAVGEKVFCTIGEWNSALPVVGVEWSWYGNGVLITNTTIDNYEITSNESGKVITCRVTVENRGNEVQSSFSNALGPVPGVPSNTAIPVITGPNTPPQVGDTLTSSQGTWTSDTPITATEYSFRVQGVAMQTGASNTFALIHDYVNSVVDVMVKVTNSSGQSAGALSDATEPVDETPPINTVLPVISGPNTPPKVGDTLTSTQGTWTTSTPITATEYDFRVQGASMQKGSTNTFPLVHEYINSVVDVVVKVTNEAGQSEGALSDATEPVDE